ncbi:MAG: ABC transporter ATP-binding protein [Desulfitobacteriia bacterium]|jgi:ATP-binding cassette subfamily B multidrug efflux pump
MLKLYRFLKPFSPMVWGVIFFVALQTVGDLYLPTLMADVINYGVMRGDLNKILHLGSVMLLVSAAGVIAAILASFLASRTAVGLGTVLRNQVFKKVVSFSLAEFDKLGSATLITRTTNDITQIQMVTLMIMRMMISAPLMAIGGLLLAFQKDRTLTLVFAIAIPLLALVIAFIASRVIPLFKLIQVKIDTLNLFLREKLTGVRVIRAFNTIEREKQRFDKANLDLTNTYIKVNLIMAFMMPAIMLVMNLTSLAILWFGGIRISMNAMDLGALAAFTQYAMMIMFSLLMLAMMFIMVPRAQAAAKRINEVLETPLSIDDSSETPDLELRPPEYSFPQGQLEFRNVTFSYEGAEEPVLQNISFSARPGEIIAIIGSTGAGKSTLINLIPRFYDVKKGQILIDGVDIRKMSPASLRKKIGLVPQKAILFSGTIAENLKFGNENVTENDLYRAVTIAQAMEFIADLEGGFEHFISQGGTNLSGGQKQRLSIARALVQNPNIYIFDDSFSALDNKTEARLRRALKRELSHSTILIVTQKVSTVLDADKIIVLDEGRIVDQGTHQELLNSCPVYQEIVASQHTEEEIL